MSDAILRTVTLQNEEIFREGVKVYLSAHNHDSGMSETQPKQHPNVAIYLRNSSPKQPESVDVQRAFMDNMIRVAGFDPAECVEYIDRDTSAKQKPAFTDRKQGKCLMADIEAGKIDYLFGFKIDRFFRRVEQGSAWMNLMASKYPHVKVQTSDCNTALNTAGGRRMWFLTLFMAEDENEVRSERTDAGNQFKRENCEKTSHAVFGWSEYDTGQMNFTQGRPVGNLIKMEPCWHEIAVIEWVHENAADKKKGLSYAAMARKLNHIGIKTATGREWTASSIGNLVRRPAKMHEQLHQFEDERPSRMISYPFRTFKPARRV